MNLHKKMKAISSSMGDEKCQLVLKNANMINVLSEEIQVCDIAIQDGIIVGIGSYIGEIEIDMSGKYISPGLIDSHVHIESTMVCPEIFASEVLPHGTTTVIADPHEITNVMGLSGVEYILEHSDNIPLNVYVMLPSCVPCSEFETNGSDFTWEDMTKIINHPRILGLGEVMDCPSVLSCDNIMMQKIDLIKNGNIDGHAPNLSSLQLQAYRLAGIKTDHESCSFESALEKIRSGFFVLIRDGSAAKSIDKIVSGILKTG
ncbi:MAG: amidohydrolase family protein, partial [Oscillospiraceae bacterium]